ncbi:TIGR02452 family protein [Polyangium sp. y55x31]|uniref:TIGR02452 family protein n=1 Tax=Polyangium sp. y55x31 TaxID=3042688 RepID=UPI0024830E88|nr:TIGR02452 family protein [Polyangium sp. y55x31]MDI1481714.1 TIGR02452 family protein [Polyangium sp. y55x31]
MKLASIATETLDIVSRGEYESAGGQRVHIGRLVEAAAAGTVLYKPGDLAHAEPRERRPGSIRLEVTDETTAAAGRRLCREGEARIAALNFASAKNPGGGFLGGAKAQEEDLARCSALYTCLVRQPRYYEANRATASMIYTDHLIYSPDVPFFRDDRLALLDEPFTLSIVTAPAPNAGEALRRDKKAGAAIREALERRAAYVLAAMALHGHRTLVLGAWGCGVFRNDPREVADVLANWLGHPRFAGAFDRVVFGIYDRSAARATLRAFEERMANP